MTILRDLRQHLLTGVSYAIPFIAAGGILIAAALAFAPAGANNAPDPSHTPFLNFMLTIGVTSFKLMLPVLAGYIAYSIAGKPGLVAGMIGGYLSDEIKAGFLGALAAGLLAGYFVQLLKKIPTSKFIRPIMPILIIPIVSSLFIGAVMMLLLGPWIAELMSWLTGRLQEMSTGSGVVFAALLGAMIAFDMGGPVNKVAFFFASGLIKDGNVSVMGPVAAAICTPPLGMGLATLIARRQWTTEQKESGLAALGMGMIGITEGAIPFAASDPLRVIPCIMLGSMAASVTAMLGHVGDHAPHGGPIVLPVVDNRWMYVVAIVVGTVATALAITAVKAMTQRPPEPQDA